MIIIIIIIIIIYYLKNALMTFNFIIFWMSELWQ